MHGNRRHADEQKTYAMPAIYTDEYKGYLDWFIGQEVVSLEAGYRFRYAHAPYRLRRKRA